MRQLSSLRERLREFGIRDAADYAEVLVAEALSGERLKSRVTKGHDLIAERYGRIEVKCRQLPHDGRVEERVAVGDGNNRFRVFYTVEAEEREVRILAIGVKERDRVFIAGEEVEL